MICAKPSPKEHANDVEGIRYSYVEDGVDIGHLTAHESGLILSVYVEPSHRGEGVARALYERADEDMGLFHVPEWGRTYAGNCFAEAVGGQVMSDEDAAAVLGLNLDDILGDGCV